jgi:hypothetical protein
MADDVKLMLRLEQQAALWRRPPRFSCRLLAAEERWETHIFAWRRARMC